MTLTPALSRKREREKTWDSLSLWEGVRVRAD
jgi:hypothetical protein